MHAGGYGEQLSVAVEPACSPSEKLNVPFSGSSKLGQSESDTVVGGGGGGGGRGAGGAGVGAGSGSEHAVAQLHTGGVVSTPVARSTHLIIWLPTAEHSIVAALGSKYVGRTSPVSGWHWHVGQPIGIVSVAVAAVASTSICPSGHVCVTQ